MVNKFKSIMSIIPGLYRDLGINTEINEGDIIEWCAEGLMLIGSFPQFEECKTIIEVKNHTASLPNNFLYIRNITFDGKPMHWDNKNMIKLSNDDKCNIPTCCTENNFYIRDCTLYTSLNCGNILIEYLGIPTDEDGYPLMPDDVYFDKALKAYCTFMLDKIQFRKGLLPQQVFQHSEREWLWYVGAAKGSANTPDRNMMERLKNVWVRLIPQQRSFDQNFVNLGKPEQRKLH